LWRDELEIGFGPARIELVRRGRGLRPRVTDADSVVVGDGSGAGWRPALETLRGALAAARWRNAGCRVVLSNHFVRYLLIDWPQGLRGAAEREALLRLRFRAVYGERSQDWRLAVSGTEAGTRGLACAVEDELLAALRETLAAARLRLEAAAPYLVVAFNRAREQVRGEETWFVAVEPGRLGLASFTGGRWASVRNERIGEDVGEALAALLAQDAAARAPAAGPRLAWVSAPHWPGALAVPGPEWQARRLRREAPGGLGTRAAEFALTLG
jgi:hypothetical protein